MRKKKMIKLLAGGAICALSFAVAAAVPMAKDIASAEDYTFEMVGAAIRPDDNYGIRFTAQTNNVSNDSKYYVMIVPNSWLTDENYLGDCGTDKDYYKHLTEVKKLKEDDPETPEYDGQFITMESTPQYQDSGEYEGKWLINGTISNVHFSNTNNQFFGVAYEKKADGTCVYAGCQNKSVRSICWVAGAALNDESANYSDTMKTKLRATVDDAYDFVKNGKETGAELDLSSFGFKQNVYYTLDQGSETKLEMTGVPEIDLPIEYSVAAGSGTPSTITEDGVLTVNDNKGYSLVNAQIAGVTNSLTVCNTPKMAEGMLQDFASYHYENDINGTRTYDINTYEITPTTSSGEWVESYTDAHGNIGYGVGKATKDKTYYSCGLRLNASRAELEAMTKDAETITVRFCATSPNNEVKKLSLRFFNGGYKAYPVNTWSYYTVTKAALISGQTGSTDEEKWNSFLDLYCNTGTGKIIGSNDGGCQNYDSGTQGKVTFYIDYVSVGTIRMEEYELENFNLSSGEISNSFVSVMTFVNPNGDDGTLVEIQADEYGNTAYNVAKGTIKANAYGIATMRFARTQDELTAMMETLDSITWRVMVNKDQTLKILGKSVALTAMKWTDVTLTRAELLANFTNQTTEAEKIAKFASVFCSTGAGNTTPRMFSVPSADCPVVLYVDGVSYTTTAE